MEGAVVVGKVRDGDESFGFNAATEKYEDLVGAGVIDPAKVTRTALQNAASIAGSNPNPNSQIPNRDDWFFNPKSKIQIQKWDILLSHGLGK